MTHEMKRKQRCSPETLATVWRVALLVFSAAAGVSAATAISSQVLPNSSGVREQDTIDLSADGNLISVVWADQRADSGIWVAQREAGVWQGAEDMTYLPPAIDLPYSWSPGVAVTGTQTAVAWIQSSAPSHPADCSTENRVMGRLLGTGPAQVVMEGVYGPYTSPDIIASSTGWHVVFSAATSPTDCTGSLLDIYYSSWTAATSSWSTPVAIVTHSAALDPNAVVGGALFPRISANPGTGELHVVWEQNQASRGEQERSIWMTVRPASSTQWSAPERLSPSAQTLAVRPSIAEASDGETHISWTVTDRLAVVTEQHIQYRSLKRSLPISLSLGADQVTGNFPTLARSTISARTGIVCVAWHGYAGAAGSGKEDIWVRCSRDKGATWGAPENWSQSTDQLSIFASAELGTDGYLNAAWVEYYLDPLGNWKPQGVSFRSGPPADNRIFLPLVMRGR